MKKTALISFILLNSFFCFAQSFPKKQTLIPLSNANGVPFYKDQELSDLVIDGFEIDNKGDFYFMGGDKTGCLAVFSGTKQVFRKNNLRLHNSQIYLCKNNLYTFDHVNNDLIILNPSNGTLIKKYGHITNKGINSYTFADSSLILEILKDTTIFHERYNLTGKFIGKAPNEFDLNPKILPEKDAQLLGMWNDNFVFWDVTGDKLDTETFWLVNKEGKVLATKMLKKTNVIFGIGYAPPTEDKKVRNGSLFVLGRKGNNALITEVPLSTFFTK